MLYALRNIGRLKGKSALTFLLAFVIIFLSMFGIMTNSLCNDSKERFYGPLDGTYAVTDTDGNPYLSYKAASYIKKHSDVISSISASKEYVIYSNTVEYVGKGEFKREYMRGDTLSPDGEYDYYKGLMLCGVSNMSFLEEVYSGKLYIVKGEMLSEGDSDSCEKKILISDRLAEKNGLDVGDEFPVIMKMLYRNEAYIARTKGDFLDDAKKYTYKISGIYHNSEENTNSVSEPYLANDNRLYVPLSTIVEISEDKTITSDAADYTSDILVVPDEMYFSLADPSAEEFLSSQLNDIGFSKGIKLTKHVSDSASSPSARLSEIISAVVIGVVGIGFIVFMLVIFFNMNSRQRELAVLCALGKRRSAVSGSFFLEIFILVLLGFAGGFGVFMLSVSAVAIPLTKYLNMAELSSTITSENADFVLIGGSGNIISTERMTDLSYMFETYMLPAMIFTAVIAVLILICAYMFISVYVRGINALSAVGGKE